MSTDNITTFLFNISNQVSCLDDYQTYQALFFIFSIVSIAITMMVLVILVSFKGDNLVILNGMYTVIFLITLNLPVKLKCWLVLSMAFWVKFILLALHLSFLLIYVKNYPAISLNKRNRMSSCVRSILTNHGPIITVLLPTIVIFSFIFYISIAFPSQISLTVSVFNRVTFITPKL